MSLSSPSRRMARSAIAFRQLTLQTHCTCLVPILATSFQHRRTIFERFFGRDKKKQKNEVLDPADPKFRRPKKPQDIPQPNQGDIAPGSIIDDAPAPTPGAETSRTGRSGGIQRNPRTMAAALDPVPRNRKRWQRKMVIRDVRRRGKLSKTEWIMRTERESLSKSPFFKTSVKKLYPLARQIAGKPIEEAIVQMRFSKKKAAVDVKKHLEYARNEAIVKRGMGLGAVKPVGEVEVEAESKEANGMPKGMVVVDKKGTKRWVADKTGMYVDQAWVGRGTYGRSPLFRAKGRTDILRHPQTSISVVLKEEATRIRLAEEREQKRQNKGTWVPLPDRPVTAQRQYPLW